MTNHHTTLRDLAQAMHNLIQTRVDNPLAGLPLVASIELTELPDASSNRPPSLVDRYRGSGATYRHAMNRLVAAGLRCGYQPGNTRICWDCEGAVDPVTLACPCFTPTR